MPMEQSDIHGHEVLGLVDGTAFTPDSLRQMVAQRWGPEARFRTCSSSGMSFDELLTFLLSREKLVLRNGCLHTNRAQICSGQ